MLARRREHLHCPFLHLPQHYNALRLNPRSRRSAHRCAPISATRPHRVALACWTIRGFSTWQPLLLIYLRGFRIGAMAGSAASSMVARQVQSPRTRAGDGRHSPVSRTAASRSLIACVGVRRRMQHNREASDRLARNCLASREKRSRVVAWLIANQTITEPHAHGAECAGRAQASAGLVAFLPCSLWRGSRGGSDRCSCDPPSLKKSPGPPLGGTFADSRGVRWGRGPLAALVRSVWLER